DRMTNQLMSEPESVCGDAFSQCTIFPEACTVSLEIAVLAKGARRTGSWGSTLADFSGNHRRVELFRHYQNELAPVEVDTRDHEALRVPLCLETLSNGGNEGGLSMRFEHWWYSVPLRVRWFLRRNRVEQELDEEFRF